MGYFLLPLRGLPSQLGLLRRPRGIADAGLSVCRHQRRRPLPLEVFADGHQPPAPPRTAGSVILKIAQPFMAGFSIRKHPQSRRNERNRLPSLAGLNNFLGTFPPSLERLGYSRRQLTPVASNCSRLTSHIWVGLAEVSFFAQKWQKSSFFGVSKSPTPPNVQLPDKNPCHSGLKGHPFVSEGHPFVSEGHSFVTKGCPDGDSF